LRRKKQRCNFAFRKKMIMNNLELYIKNDTTKIVTNDDTLTYLCAEHQECNNQYKDFKFITESSGKWNGPQQRDVSFVSAGWNFTILFVVMMIVVLNKFLAPTRFASIIIMPFQNGGEKLIRESNSFLNIMSLSMLVSFVLILSMFIQKIFVVYGGNRILHDNFDFFLNVVICVTTIFVYNYLLTVFYGWLFKADSLIHLHFASHVSSMAICNILLMPIILLLFFHPYKLFLIFTLILTAVFFVITLVKLLIEVRMLSKLNFVNIFLYLCTVEILPVLVISKMIVNVL
jgi:hypothetical protein